MQSFNLQLSYISESAIGLSTIGIFFLFQAVLGILAIPADFGLRGAIEKRISEEQDQGAFLASAFIIKSVPIVIICSAIALTAPYINEYVGTTVAVYLIIAILLQEIANLSISVLKGELRVEETASLQILRKIIWVVTSVLLVIHGLEVEALIFGILSGLVTVSVIGWLRVSIQPTRPSLKHFRSLFSYAKYNLVSSVGGYFYNWMDIVIIGYFLSPSHVGAYEIAWRITSFTIIFSKALSTTFFPQVSNWHASDSKEKIETKLTELLALTPLIVVPAFFGVALYSVEILSIVFSEDAAIAWLALIVLMTDEITESVQTVLGRSLQAVNRPDLAARATIVAVILNLILNVLLIQQYGIAGAAVATTLASLVGGVILHWYYLQRFLTIRAPIRAWFECCVASGLMAVCLLVLEQITPVETIVQLTIVIVVGVISYSIFVLFSPTLKTLVRDQLNQLRSGSGESLYTS
ncbi:oligosaccharide flippase family protein [Natronoarchaeum sp. GCM10025703]|uniref:oligosaccharide flippase family protein n=1 Tax=Natronoarchaeum sp. GCM10025703 TaxID=3252685 RepID=UPI0036117171